jgi:hypothetical protein
MSEGAFSCGRPRCEDDSWLLLELLEPGLLEEDCARIAGDKEVPDNVTIATERKKAKRIERKLMRGLPASLVRRASRVKREAGFAVRGIGRKGRLSILGEIPDRDNKWRALS